jgi:hypothetical protein
MTGGNQKGALFGGEMEKLKFGERTRVPRTDNGNLANPFAVGIVVSGCHGGYDLSISIFAFYGDGTASNQPRRMYDAHCTDDVLRNIR